MIQCLNAEKALEKKKIRSRIDTGDIFGSYRQDQNHSLETVQTEVFTQVLIGVLKDISAVSLYVKCVCGQIF